MRRPVERGVLGPWRYKGCFATLSVWGVLRCKERERATQSLKRKAVEDQLEKKRTIRNKGCDILQKGADQLAEQAEGKAGSIMAQLIK